MNLTIEGSALARALDLVCSSVDNKPTLPIAMQNVLFAVSKETITITGSDMSVRATAIITEGFEVTTPGTALLSGEKLLQLAKTGKGINLSIITNKSNQTEIKRAGTKLTCYPLKEIQFPSAPELPKSFVEMKSSTLSFLLTQVAFACDENKNFGKVTDSVLIDIENNKFVAVGTDGIRVAIARTTAPSSEEGVVFPVTIPTRAIKSILIATRSTPADSGVLIGKSSNQLFFKFENFLISSAQFAESYPNWRKVVPDIQAEGVSKIEFDTIADFKMAISDMVLIKDTAPNASTTVKLEMNAAGNSLTVEKMGTEGEVKSVIECAGQPLLKFLINPKQLLDYLNTLSTIALTIFFVEKAPLYFYSATETELRTMEYLQAQTAS